MFFRWITSGLPHSIMLYYLLIISLSRIFHRGTYSIVVSFILEALSAITIERDDFSRHRSSNENDREMWSTIPIIESISRKIMKKKQKRIIVIVLLLLVSILLYYAICNSYFFRLLVFRFEFLFVRKRSSRRETIHRNNFMICVAARISI